MTATVRRPYIQILIAATLIIGACWGGAVPPFESADESSFYNAIVRYTHGENPGGWLLYAAAVRPVMKLAGGPDRPVEAQRNPSFRYIGNVRGTVNRWMHGRAENMPRGDVNRLYLLRLCTLLMWVASLALIFEAARLYFGRSDLALLTAGACLFLPEASFFASKIHPEATTVLLASATYCVFTARVFGRVSRGLTWLLALAVLLAAPFSDRQAYFLVLLVPFGLVVTEPTRKGALVTAAAMLGAAIAALVVLPKPVEMQRDLTMWLTPMLGFFKFAWWNPYLRLHLKYEFIPKMFLGFTGWLGQPSILLPPAVYAAFVVTAVLALLGFVLPAPSRQPPLDSARGGPEPAEGPPAATGDSPAQQRRRVAWFFAGGVFLTLAPILYTNAMIERIVVGRWMLPSLAPIMIAVVAGLDRFVRAAVARPRRVAAIVGALGGVLLVMWISPAGGAIRDGIRHYHYGDQEHLIRIVTDALAGVLIAAVLVVLIARLRGPERGPFQGRGAVTIFGAAGAANLALLFLFVVPLYRPFDDREFADAIRAEADAGEFDRAAGLLRIAQRAYPESAPLARIPTERPLIALRGNSDQLLADFEARIGRGQVLDSRDDLMALARAVPKAGRFEPDALREALARAKVTPQTAEPLALIRAEVEGRQRDGSAAADVIRASGGTIMQAEMHGVAMLEGFTTYHRPGEDAIEVRIYFRPLRDWSPVMRLLFGVRPHGSPDGPTPIDFMTPAFGGWRKGELAWETFAVAASTAWDAWSGVEVEHNTGDGIELGVIR